MNKKKDKTTDKKTELKKLSQKRLVLLKKRKKLKKILLQVLLTFIQLLITQLYQLQMIVEMLYLGLQLVQKVLKVQENLHLMPHKLLQMMLVQKLLNRD